MDALNGQQEKW